MTGLLRRRDVVELLEAQHDACRDVFDHLLAATDERRQGALLASLDESLRMLATLEEEVFYHRFKAASATNQQRRMYLEAHEQHRAIELLLDELKQVPVGTETFWAKTRVLRGLLLQHAQHEQSETFVAARNLLGDDDLRDLARDLRRRRWELKTEKKGMGEETLAERSASGWLVR
jgi:hypothetical protein